MKTWTTVSTAWRSFVEAFQPTASEVSTAKAVWTSPTVNFKSRTGAAALAW